MSPEPADVLQLLGRRRETLAAAESLTGGLLGARLTAVAGASAVYRGGVIVYATDLKAELAGVSPATLAAEGPVSAVTAAELARGVRMRCAADWGLAVTGVAGPEAQEGHPVGQVFVAVAGSDIVTTSELRLEGGRDRIREDTVTAAWALLVAVVARAPSAPSGGGGPVGVGG